MAYNVLLHERVQNDDIPSLPTDIRVRVKTAIETRLTTSPDQYGKPLRKWLAGYWKLRVGDWRVIYRIAANDEVRVLIIAHRSRVYDMVLQRIPS
ncbi:type II toxin-antitoxin system RelE/ParE family toxin [Candidatus Uhrbacteria bacterium]|nr:type II toxin-antitoxin system RelE/ParE family toxin [Candidatus Uhrbacteria bacterium]